MEQVRYAFENPRIQADNAAGLTIATNAIQALDEHYPGWGWHVMVRGGIMMIRLSHVSQKWGMNTRLREFDHDATSLKKRVIMAAGEFLERAKQKRGEWQGQRIHVNQIEGVTPARRAG